MSQKYECGVCSDTGFTSDGRTCGHCLQGTVRVLESELNNIQGQNEILKRKNQELKAKLSVNKCNSGHVTLPISLWDCPVCTQKIRDENLNLKREICQRMADDSAAMSNVLNHGKTKEECAIEREWPDIFEE